MKEEIKKLLERHKNNYKYRLSLSPILREIAEEVAEETGENLTTVSTLISGYFDTLAMILDDVSNLKGEPMKIENFKSVMFMYLGKFLPSKKRINQSNNRFLKYRNITKEEWEEISKLKSKEDRIKKIKELHKKRKNGV